MADEKLISKVKETLDAFRPQLNADGGDMEFICIDDDRTEFETRNSRILRKIYSLVLDHYLFHGLPLFLCKADMFGNNMRWFRRSFPFTFSRSASPFRHSQRVVFLSSI